MEMSLKERRTQDSDGILGIKVAATENGEYGRMKPGRLYLC